VGSNPAFGAVVLNVQSVLLYVVPSANGAPSFVSVGTRYSLPSRRNELFDDAVVISNCLLPNPSICTSRSHRPAWPPLPNTAASSPLLNSSSKTRQRGARSIRTVL
jgi:hypothetical protein